MRFYMYHNRRIVGTQEMMAMITVLSEETELQRMSCPRSQLRGVQLGWERRSSKCAGRGPFNTAPSS